MKITNIGIFLSWLLVAGLCSSCGERGINTKLMLNEVLVNNESNYQDDYGMHSAWIEIFNKSYGSADLAGCYLKCSSRPGDTLTYFIPKGDILTQVKPRQHALFWADGEPRRGTFHTNFKLDTVGSNWIGLYDAGKKLIDQITIPAGLQANQSYARVYDACEEWEVKGATADNYVTPSTNNQTLDSNAKMERFAEDDGNGFGMAITAMSVVFTGLLVLYLSFKLAGRTALGLHERRKARKRQNAKAKTTSTAPASPQANEESEVYAAIAMALYELQDDVHDVENTVLTIRRNGQSPWNSKVYTLREIPQKK